MKNARPILVVEDIDEDFTVLCWAFEKASIINPIERCKTAEDAILFLGASGMSASSPPVCLVLLDLNLPDADGATVLRHARQMYGSAMLPVVVYSTASRHQTINACYQAGASSYVVKPLGLDKAENFAKALRAWWLETAQILIE